MARDAFGRFSRPISNVGVGGYITALASAIEQGPELKRALEATGEHVVATIEVMMEDVGPPPSPPYGPPAIDTGTLVSSYRYTVDYGDQGLELAVGSDLIYAGFLEFGTVKMLPRPHLAPAMEVTAQDSVQEFADAVVMAERTALRGMPSEIIIG